MTARPSGKMASLGALLGAAITVVLVTLLGALLLIAAGQGPTLFGYRSYIVDGGGLGSSLSTRSIAVTEPTDPADLEVGDVIAYRPADEFRRIVSVSAAGSEPAFVLESGQATTGAQPVTLGRSDRLVYSVPVAGAFVAWASDPLGAMTIIAPPVALFALALLSNVRARRTDSQDQVAIELSRVLQFSSRGETMPRPRERILLHEMPLLKMVPLATALDMAYRERKRARDERPDADLKAG